MNGTNAHLDGGVCPEVGAEASSDGQQRDHVDHHLREAKLQAALRHVWVGRPPHVPDYLPITKTIKHNC